MENYELVDLSDGLRYSLLGLSEEQKYAFDYGVSVGGCVVGYSIHLSHILNGDNIIVYNKNYKLKNEDVEYLYKDLGGQE